MPTSQQPIHPGHKLPNTHPPKLTAQKPPTTTHDHQFRRFSRQLDDVVPISGGQLAQLRGRIRIGPSARRDVLLHLAHDLIQRRHHKLRSRRRISYRHHRVHLGASLLTKPLHNCTSLSSRRGRRGDNLGASLIQILQRPVLSRPLPVGFLKPVCQRHTAGRRRSPPAGVAPNLNSMACSTSGNSASPRASSRSITSSANCRRLGSTPATPTH